MFDLPALIERASEHIKGDEHNSTEGSDTAGQTVPSGQSPSMSDGLPVDEWQTELRASGLGLTLASERQIDQLLSLLPEGSEAGGGSGPQHSVKSSH